MHNCAPPLPRRGAGRARRRPTPAARRAAGAGVLRAACAPGVAAPGAAAAPGDPAGDRRPPGVRPSRSARLAGSPRASRSSPARSPGCCCTGRRLLSWLPRRGHRRARPARAAAQTAAGLGEQRWHSGLRLAPAADADRPCRQSGHGSAARPGSGAIRQCAGSGRRRLRAGHCSDRKLATLSMRRWRSLRSFSGGGSNSSVETPSRPASRGSTPCRHPTQGAWAAACPRAADHQMRHVAPPR